MKKEKKEGEMKQQTGVEITPPIITTTKDATAIFERELRSIIKQTSIFDYKSSIEKKFYFDVVDVLMHMISGMRSIDKSDFLIIGNSQIILSASIMNLFHTKQKTMQEAIELAFNSGTMFIHSKETTL